MLASLAELVYGSVPEGINEEQVLSTFAEFLQSRIAAQEEDMKIQEGSAGEREVCPAGFKLADCTGFKDLGVLPDSYGNEKHMVEVRFETEEKNKKGFKFVLTRKYNWVWGNDEKPSSIRRDLEAWTGKSYSTKEARANFDSDELIGKKALLQVQHKPGRSGGVFANITAVLPPLTAPVAAPVAATTAAPAGEVEPF